MQPFASATLPRFALWHLFSLDAPTVAVLWTAFGAAVTHSVLPPVNYLAMGLAVWTLYALDRLLDSRHLASSNSEGRFRGMEYRHLFHHRHRSGFLAVIAVSVVLLLFLLPRLSRADFRLYFMEGVLFSAYFASIHSATVARIVSLRVFRLASRIMPKETIVGPFFASSVFIPILTRNPTLRLSLLPMAVLFAVLCSLNCLYIYAWEHPDGLEGSWTAACSSRNLTGFTKLFVLFSFVWSLPFLAMRGSSLALYPLACGGSAFLLFTIHRFRGRLSPLILRTAADAALLTPTLFLPFSCHFGR